MTGAELLIELSKLHLADPEALQLPVVMILHTSQDDAAITMAAQLIRANVADVGPTLALTNEVPDEDNPTEPEPQLPPRSAAPDRPR